MEKIYQGTIKWFNVEKGFGFIYSRELKEEVFFHVEQLIMEGLVLPKRGEKVEFQIYKDKRGMKAMNVYKIKENP